MTTRNCCSSFSLITAPKPKLCAPRSKCYGAPWRRSWASLSFRALQPTTREDQRAPLTRAQLLRQPLSSAIARSSMRPKNFDYQVSAGAFFQVNRFLLDDLIETVTAGQSGKVALDLYAGGGFFSLPLAENFQQVIAVEASTYSYSRPEEQRPAKREEPSVPRPKNSCAARYAAIRPTWSSSIRRAPGLGENTARIARTYVRPTCDVRILRSGHPGA